jgi:hypothetical protein
MRRSQNADGVAVQRDLHMLLEYCRRYGNILRAKILLKISDWGCFQPSILPNCRIFCYSSPVVKEMYQNLVGLSDSLNELRSFTRILNARWSPLFFQLSPTTMSGNACCSSNDANPLVDGRWGRVEGQEGAERSYRRYHDVWEGMLYLRSCEPYSTSNKTEY